MLNVSKSITPNLYAYCDNDPVNKVDPSGYLTWPGQVHTYVQLIMSSYITLFLGELTFVNYFIRFSLFRYGFADLYAKNWNEIWEVKPDKIHYQTSGPMQLQKYIDAVDGSKAGRNLGNFITYFYFNGIYRVYIRSNSYDGMIYYKFEYCWDLNIAIALAVGSFVLISTGVGSGVGATGLTAAGNLVLCAI